VTHPHEIAKHYVCGLCNPPARAGKGRATGALRIGEAVALAEGADVDADDVEFEDTQFGDLVDAAALATVASGKAASRAAPRRDLAMSH
jgi:hypothetical protein